MMPDTPVEFLRAVVYSWMGIIVLVTLVSQTLRGGP